MYLNLNYVQKNYLYSSLLKIFYQLIIEGFDFFLNYLFEYKNLLKIIESLYIKYFYLFYKG